MAAAFMIFVILGIIVTSTPVADVIAAFRSLPVFVRIVIYGGLFFLFLLFAYGDTQDQEKAEKKEIQKKGDDAEARVDNALEEWVKHQKETFNRDFILIKKDCEPLPFEGEFSFNENNPLYKAYSFIFKFRRRKKAQPSAPRYSINIVNDKVKRGASEIDHIVVGDGIVIHIETKSFCGKITIQDNDTWVRQSFFREKPYSDQKTPEKQTLSHQLALRKVVGQKAGVFGVICLAGMEEYTILEGATETLQFPIYALEFLPRYLDFLVVTNNTVNRAAAGELASIINASKVHRICEEGHSPEPELQPASPKVRSKTDAPINYVVFATDLPGYGYNFVPVSFYFGYKDSASNEFFPVSWRENQYGLDCGAYIVREHDLLAGRPAGYIPSSDDVIRHRSSRFVSTRGNTIKLNHAKNAFEFKVPYNKDCMTKKNRLVVVFTVTRKSARPENPHTNITFMPSYFNI